MGWILEQTKRFFIGLFIRIREVGYIKNIIAGILLFGILSLLWISSNSYAAGTTTDTTPPTFTFSLTKSGQNYKIHVVASDQGSGVNNIILPNGSVITGSVADYSTKSEGNYLFRCTDMSGNVTSQYYYIDSTNPTIQITQTGNYLTAIASDGGSGVKRIRFGSNAWVDGTQIVQAISAIGTYTFYAEDISGNLGSQSINVTTITPAGANDVTPPTIMITRSGDTLNALAVDDISGVKSITGPDNVIVQGNSASYTATAIGTYYFTAVDNKGNVGTKSYAVTSLNTGSSSTDKTAPAISDFNINYNATQTTNPTVLLNLFASDNKSQPTNLKVEFSIDGVNWVGFNGTGYVNNYFGIYQNQYTGYDLGTLLGNKIVTVRVTDEAGNQTTKTASIELVASNGSPGPISNGNGTGLSSSDPILVRDSYYSMELSGLSGQNIQYSIDGVVWSPWETINEDGTANKSISFDGTDGIHTANVRTQSTYYNTTSAITTYYFMVDRSAPELSVRTIDGSHIAINGSISFLVEGTDRSSVPMVCDVQIYDKNNLKLAESLGKQVTSGTPTVIPINGLPINQYYYVVFKLTDKAGNLTKQTINILSK